MIAGGNVFHSFHLVGYDVKVLVSQLHLFPWFYSGVWNAGLAGIYSDAVSGVIPELPQHPVAKAGAKSEEQDKHKNTPGDTECGEKSSELILIDRVKDLFPLVEIKH